MTAELVRRSGGTTLSPEPAAVERLIGRAQREEVSPSQKEGGRAASGSSSGRDHGEAGRAHGGASARGCQALATCSDMTWT